MSWLYDEEDKNTYGDPFGGTTGKNSSNTFMPKESYGDLSQYSLDPSSKTPRVPNLTTNPEWMNKWKTMTGGTGENQAALQGFLSKPDYWGQLEQDYKKQRFEGPFQNALTGLFNDNTPYEAGEYLAGIGGEMFSRPEFAAYGTGDYESFLKSLQARSSAMGFSGDNPSVVRSQYSDPLGYTSSSVDPRAAGIANYNTAAAQAERDKDGFGIGKALLMAALLATGAGAAGYGPLSGLFSGASSAAGGIGAAEAAAAMGGGIDALGWGGMAEGLGGLDLLSAAGMGGPDLAGWGGLTEGTGGLDLLGDVISGAGGNAILQGGANTLSSVFDPLGKFMLDSVPEAASTFAPDYAAAVQAGTPLASTTASAFANEVSSLGGIGGDTSAVMPGTPGEGLTRGISFDNQGMGLKMPTYPSAPGMGGGQGLVSNGMNAVTASNAAGQGGLMSTLGDIWDFYKGNKGLINGALQAGSSLWQAGQMKDMLNKVQGNAEPFRSLLAGSYTNPEAYLNSPEFQAAYQREFDRSSRQGAAKGTRLNPQTLSSNMGQWALANLNQYRQPLAQLTTGLNPGASSMIQGQQNLSNIYNNAFGAIPYSIQFQEILDKLGKWDRG